LERIGCIKCGVRQCARTAVEESHTSSAKDSWNESAWFVHDLTCPAVLPVADESSEQEALDGVCGGYAGSHVYTDWIAEIRWLSVVQKYPLHFQRLAICTALTGPASC